MKHAKPDDRDYAFARWYAETAGPTTRRVAAAVGDAALAREATAEAFARAFERWSRVQRLDAPEAWVCTVAVNLCRRSWRRRALEARALSRAGSLRAEPVAPSEPPDDELRQAVDDLPARMRAAVTLRYWEDLPEHEVARRMDVAPGTASALLSQARRRLGAHVGTTRRNDDG